MKLDSDSIYAHSTLASTPDSQIFHYNDTTVETAWKVNNDLPVEDKMKAVSDPDIEKNENNTNSLHTPDEYEEDRNIPRLHALNTVGTSVNEDETEHYTDKNVTELELPKVPVCFEEDDGDHHTVKDICIDDGFPSPGRNLLENCEIHNKATFNSEYLDSYLDNSLSSVNVDNPVPILSEANPFIGSEGKSHVIDDYSYETFNPYSEEDNDQTVNVNTAETSGFNTTNPFLDCDSDSELDFAKISLPENFNFDYESSTGNGDKRSYQLVDDVGANPFLESGSEAGVAERSFPEDLFDKDNSDATGNLISDEKTSHVTSLGIPEFNASSSHELSISDQEQSDQGTSKDAHSAEPIMPSTAEETVDDTHKTPHSAEPTVPSSAEETVDDTHRMPHSAEHTVPSTAEETVDDTSGETHLAQSVLPLTAEEINDCTQSVSFVLSPTNETSDDSNREAESVMPLTGEETNEEHLNNTVKIVEKVDSSTPAPGGREDLLKSIEIQAADEKLSTPITGEETVDSRTASSRSFFIQHGYGETSFSTTGPLSGPIAYSGPISNSGSTSLRSDSSTTSARSFAFPVINTEWISSPVKMAKADRKQIRKHRGWLLSLLCCRF